MPKTHNGLGRREFLRIGGLGAAGLSLPGLFKARAGQSKSPIPAERGKSRNSSVWILIIRAVPSARSR